MLIQHTQPPL